MQNMGVRDLVKQYWGELVLAVLFLITLIYNLVWLQAEKLPPSWDPSAHLMLSLAYYNVLTHPSLDMVGRLVDISNYYPPFYHFSTAVMYLFFGKSMDTAILTNTVFYGVLITSAYGLGKKLFNKETGVLAAALLTLYPSIFSLQRVYMLEIPLTALVALAIYLLVLSDNFRSLRYSLAFGAVFALTVLAKWTGMFFIIGPLLVTVHDAYSSRPLESKLTGLFKKDKSVCAQCGTPVGEERCEYRGKTFCSSQCKSAWKKRDRTEMSHTAQTVNLLSGIAVSIFLASLWYLPHLSDVYNNVIVGQTAAGAMEGDPEVFSLPSMLYYLVSVIDFQVLAVFFVVAVLGAIQVVKREKPNRVFLLLWVLVPYIAFTLFRNKDPRTFLPVVTVVALISAFYVSGIKNNRRKMYAIAALLVIGTAQLYTMAAGMDSLSDATRLDVPLLGSIKIFPHTGLSARPPDRSDWKAEDAIKDILYDYANNPRTRGRYAIVGVIPDHGLVNGYTLNYFAMRDELPLSVINAAYLPSTTTFTENFLRFDYLISKDGEYWSSTYKDKVVFMNGYFEAHKSEAYSLIKTYTLPDGSNLYIYRNIG